MPLKFYNFRCQIREFAGRYPFVFYSTYGIKYPNNTLVVRKDTQLVIEGYPRSANTFAVLAFEKMQDKPVKIAHHLHVPAQIYRAVKWKIPTLVLIRHPKEAVLSLMIRNPGISISFALKSYVAFYNLIGHDRSYVVGCFDEVTNDFASVIQKVNEKFDSHFVIKSISQNDQVQIFNTIRQLSQTRVSGSQVRAAFPSHEKELLKKQALRDLLDSSYGSLLLEAEETYERFISFR